ncbi:hypothetical protein [Actinoplanes solisilvae]|uniref:hypothetical protein n=1 Tax=Actinoplanes solisilvae TaxID=2486853 RepID=UPI000FD90DC8|nr:hypothetical protein [Actinoplanes solisilvae]
MVLTDDLAATAAQTLPVFAFAASIELAVHSRIVSSRFKEIEQLSTMMVDVVVTAYEERRRTHEEKSADPPRSLAELIRDDPNLDDAARAKLVKVVSPEFIESLAATGSVPGVSYLLLRLIPTLAFTVVMLLVVLAESMSVLHLADVTVPQWSAAVIVWAMISAMILLVAIPAVTGPFLFFHRFSTWPITVARKVLTEHPELRDEIVAAMAESRWRGLGHRLVRWISRP